MVWGTHFGEAGRNNLGAARAARSQVANESSKAVVNVTLSSDVISESESYRADAFIGMKMSITRREYDEISDDFFGSASVRLKLQDAVSAYAVSSAKQLGLESVIGSLQVGKRADFIILNENIFEK